MDTREDILLVDKPKGITSFDVIRRLRKELGSKKMGHAGTLDPLASGLMIIGIGPGTKKLTEYTKLPKTYEAEIIIGERRDTGDLEGEIVEERDVGEISHEDVQQALKSMIGVLELPVSAYSAIKQGGKPLYERVRSGEDVALPVRRMDVYTAALTGMERRGDRLHVFVTFDVSSGTYIRSLAEELGRRLPARLRTTGSRGQAQAGRGYPATLGNLRRTKIGKFEVRAAKSV